MVLLKLCEFKGSLYRASSPNRSRKRWTKSVIGVGTSSPPSRKSSMISKTRWTEKWTTGATNWWLKSGLHRPAQAPGIRSTTTHPVARTVPRKDPRVHSAKRTSARTRWRVDYD